MRILVATISVFGILLFGSAWVAAWVSPAFVESMGREIVRIEVQRQVDEKLDTLDNSRIGKLAERLSGRNAAEIDDIKHKFAQGIPQRIDALIAKMLDPNCTCRQLLHFATRGYKDRWSILSRLNERLDALVQAKYMDTTAKLIREFRIFSGANALVFALLGLTVLLRKRANQQLIVPTVVLVGAATLVACLYLFEQDWLHTIVFGDYVGFAYFGYLGIALGFLSDIAFNRARVTTMLVNLALNIVGGVASAVPC